MKIHGHLGYSTELPLQQRLRDVMAYLVADGTAEIQKRVIAGELVRRPSGPVPRRRGAPELTPR
jgi:cyclohexanecarboxyl-CoA dehydrogenase